MSAADLVDEAADEVVVVYGSEPPAGRDLDLLTGRRSAERLDRVLRAAGYERHGRTYALFQDGDVAVVDLTTPDAWGLSPEVAENLLAQAVPLDGRVRLSRPSPAHRLLLEARRLVRGDGALKPSARSRVMQALADPGAEQEARRLAAGWGLGLALPCLLDAVDGAPVPPVRLQKAREETVAQGSAAGARSRRRAHARERVLGSALLARRRGRLVALSGLDGSGKSSQAESLAASLEKLGFDTVVVWTRLGSGERLRRFASPLRRVLRPLLARSSGAPAPSRYAAHVAPADPVRSLRERSRLLTFAWALVVVLDHALQQRRNVGSHLRAGRVVICDRWAVDSLVHLRYRYGGSTSLTAHERLLRALAPRADAAFLLDVPGAVAFGRKREQYSQEQLVKQERLYSVVARQLGAHVVDGTGPAAEIADVLGRHTWRSLHGASARSLLARLAAARRGRAGGSR